MDKPLYGSPCNGCGHCCQTEACKLSLDFLNSAVAPCIALEQEDGRFWCGLVRNPAKYLGLTADWQADESRRLLSPGFAFALGLGAGCDAEDDSIFENIPTTAALVRSPDNATAK